MYQLKDTQIDFILNDIRARGVEMEGLQDNLLDHVCCIIEQNLEENGDFESFYQKTIKQFYKDALWEIEEETLLLLTFKNYYTMKKIMIWSGTFSVFTLIFGIWFKFMHWPGAGMLISSGLLSGSLIFLPLLFTLKAKEKQKTKDKFVMGVAAIGVILVSLSFLFKVMHWPYSVEMVYVSAILMLFIFLPIYFLSGIKNEDTKLNTITTSMLVVMVYGLLFMLVRVPSTSALAYIGSLQEVGISQEILMNEERLNSGSQDLISPEMRELNQKLNQFCIDYKSSVYEETDALKHDSTSHSAEFNHNKPMMADPIKFNESSREKLIEFRELIEKYNQEITKLGSKKLSRIRVNATFLDTKIEAVNQLTNLNVIHQLIQIQMLILQNTRTMIALQNDIKKAEQPVQLSNVK